MSNLIHRYDLFPSPIWQFEYPNFEQDKYDIINYLMRDELYFTKLERNKLLITEGNLHTNHEFLIPVRNFIQSSFELTMNELGYEAKCGITSMWATAHQQGGFHHEHSHKNSFLAAVFYVFDDNGGASGTTFKNNNSNLYQISPRLKKGVSQFFSSEKEIPFTSGKLIVFPSWLTHYTKPSKSTIRLILSANCMPIGRTNSDHYDQYEYPDPSDIGFLDLENHIKQGYGKR